MVPTVTIGRLMQKIDAPMHGSIELFRESVNGFLCRSPLFMTPRTLQLLGVAKIFELVLMRPLKHGTSCYPLGYVASTPSPDMLTREQEGVRGEDNWACAK